MISYFTENVESDNFWIYYFLGEMNMKKIIVAAVMMAAMGFAFAEGWDVNGYFRSGIEGNFDAKDAETKVYKDGKYYGNGKSRVRLNINFDQDFYGFKFRYQCDGFGFTKSQAKKVSVKDSLGMEIGSFDDTSVKEVWFTQNNLKYLMGYAKFMDGKIIGEAGKLFDGYTASEGREGYDITASGSEENYGARVVVNPVKGLYLAAQGSTYRAEKYKSTDKEVKDGKASAGELKFNEKLLGFSAKYKNEMITVSGGYHLAGDAFGYVGFTGVKNLKCWAEGKFLDKEISGKTDKNGKKVNDLVLVELVNYNFKGVFAPLEVGMMAYQKIVTDNSIYEFYPHTSYAFTDVIAADFEVGIIKYSEPSKHKDKKGKDTSTTYNITPSLRFIAGKKAFVKVYYNYDRDDKHAVGTTLKVNY